MSQLIFISFFEFFKNYKSFLMLILFCNLVFGYQYSVIVWANSLDDAPEDNFNIMISSTENDALMRYSTIIPFIINKTDRNLWRNLGSVEDARSRPLCIGTRCGVTNCFDDSDCLPDQVCSKGAIGASMIRNQGVTAASLGAPRFATLTRRPLIFPITTNIIPAVSGILRGAASTTAPDLRNPNRSIIGAGFCLPYKSMVEQGVAVGTEYGISSTLFDPDIIELPYGIQQAHPWQLPGHTGSNISQKNQSVSQIEMVDKADPELIDALNNYLLSLKQEENQTVGYWQPKGWPEIPSEEKPRDQKDMKAFDLSISNNEFDKDFNSRNIPVLGMNGKFQIYEKVSDGHDQGMLRIRQLKQYADSLIDEEIPNKSEFNRAEIEGFGTSFLNFMNATLGSLQVTCLNPIKMAAIGQTFDIDLSEHEPRVPNIIRNELFQISFLTSAPMPRPFVYVKELLTKRNVGNKVTVKCRTSGRYPMFFLIEVYYGLEFKGGKMICMAQTICDNQLAVPPPIPSFSPRSSTWSTKVPQPASIEFILNEEFRDDKNSHTEGGNLSDAIINDGRKSSNLRGNYYPHNEFTSSFLGESLDFPLSPSLTDEYNDLADVKSSQPREFKNRYSGEDEHDKQAIQILCHKNILTAIDFVGREISLNVKGPSNDVFYVRGPHNIGRISVETLVKVDRMLERRTIITHKCEKAGKTDMQIVAIAKDNISHETDAESCKVILECLPGYQQYVMP